MSPPYRSSLRCACSKNGLEETSNSVGITDSAVDIQPASRKPLSWPREVLELQRPRYDEKEVGHVISQSPSVFLCWTALAFLFLSTAAAKEPPRIDFSSYLNSDKILRIMTDLEKAYPKLGI